MELPSFDLATHVGPTWAAIALVSGEPLLYFGSFEGIPVLRRASDGTSTQRCRQLNLKVLLNWLDAIAFRSVIGGFTYSNDYRRVGLGNLRCADRGALVDRNAN